MVATHGAIGHTEEMIIPSDNFPETDVSDLQVLYSRPGFLLRRAHQIAVSLFVKETAPHGVTTTQWGMMFILRARPGLDQIGLAKLLGLDRSTTGLVVAKLETEGLVIRTPAKVDRRRKELTLTPKGEALMRDLAEPARQAHGRVLAPFTREEREQFLELLTKFVGFYNGVVRTPLMPEE
jgi:MarR family transcriptional regulator, lower aerobic nicotinate degradation pathway regulator